MEESICALSSKPIEEFKSQEQLDECLKWWQEKLFLTDWIIVAHICEPTDFSVEGRCGENCMLFENKACKIRILDKEHYGDRIIKYCAELILIHEILHCKYNFLVPNGNYEGKYLDVMEHALLEQMAKSLIMVKYGLDFSYFVG